MNRQMWGKLDGQADFWLVCKLIQMDRQVLG